MGESATKSLYIAAFHGLNVFHAKLQRNSDSFQTVTQDFPWRFRNLISGQDVRSRPPPASGRSFFTTPYSRRGHSTGILPCEASTASAPHAYRRCFEQKHQPERAACRPKAIQKQLRTKLQAEMGQEGKFRGKARAIRLTTGGHGQNRIGQLTSP